MELEKPYLPRELRQGLESQSLSAARHSRSFRNTKADVFLYIIFDVYRIGDIEEMEEIGYDDYFFGQGICLIEWADLIEEILPEKLIKVTIEKDLEKGFDYRRITVIGPENS